HIRWFHLKDIYYSLLLAAAIPFIFLFTQHNKIDRYLGELSYPVYLSHTIVIVALANTHIQTINANVFTALAVLGTIAVSVLIVRYFDQPIEKWRQARVRATAQLSGWHQCLVEGQKQSRVGHERVFSNS